MIRYICGLLLSFVFLNAHAQNKTPDDFLGYPLGSKFSYHHSILDYYKTIAAQHPDRVKLIHYGNTYEGRPLMVAVVASPENLANLENIRNNHLKSIKLLPGQADIKTPAIAWLGYNIHGNEAASSETAMQVLYELLNKNNASTQAALKNTIVILDPCSNPDGRERYVSWYNRVQNTDPDITPFALEHDEPWPGGRFNHYLFDLNRDWAWQTQQETQARVALYNQWMPHLHADFHEMGATRSYYFPPAAKPYHQDITKWQREFNELLGANCRKYFDQRNWTYFSKKDYDLFYPSYGDTWPTYNGAIGITYEQGGGSRGGLALSRPNQNDTLTLKSRIEHHYVTSIATLETISSQKEKIVNEFISFYDNAVQKPIGTYKTYLIKSQGNEERLRSFAEWLTKQGFEYGVAGKSSSLKGTELTNLTEQTVKSEANDLVISAYQPKSNLLKILFESQPALEDSITYDITSWGLSYLYGLQSYGLKEKLTPAAYQSEIINNKVPEVKPYAYLAPWKSVNDAVFLAELLRRKILVRSSNVPFVTNKMSFDAGTLIIAKKGNSAANFDSLVTALATKHHVKLFPTTTGSVSSGVDFGSDQVVTLKSPKIVTLYGEGISTTSLGAVWHYFEQQIKYPLTLISTSKITQLPLDQVDILILPDGNYATILNDKTLAALQEWIKRGGKVIAMEDANDAFLNKPGFEISKKNSASKKNSDPFRKFGEQEREESSYSSPGSMYQVSLDATHPLAFGCSKEYFSIVRNAHDIDYLTDGWNVGYLSETAYKAGFVGNKATEKLKNTLIMGVQEMGRGQILYLMDDPLFRGMLYNGKILFSNAVFR
jgi:hypothetical protein